MEIIVMFILVALVITNLFVFTGNKPHPQKIQDKEEVNEEKVNHAPLS